MLTRAPVAEHVPDEGTDSEVDGGEKAATNAVKRYNLSLPVELYKNLQQVAKSRHTTVLDLLRRFVSLGLYAISIDDDPETELLVRKGDEIREIKFF